jgi:hypothetical protein
MINISFLPFQIVFATSIKFISSELSFI